MFNLDQLQKRLQEPGVTDQVLIHYVQNPNGQVPSVMALAELKRRQELRASKTPQEQAQNVMQPTVADKVIAQDTQANMGPDFRSQGLPAVDQQMQAQKSMGQGISNLPLPETMYDEKNFASGGIVAFDDGGNVDLKTRSRFNPLTNEENQIIAAQYGLGADVGNRRGSIGAEYAGIVDQQGASVPRLNEVRGRYMTDQGNEYDARYMPDARALSVDRNAGRTSMGADIAPGPDNSMGLRSIRGSYITDNGTRYGAGYNVDSRRALLERINQEGNSLGITASPDSVGVQGQYGFAQGGIVAFDDGGSVWDRMKFGFSSPDEIRAAQGQGSASPFMGSGMPSADVDPTTLLYQKKALYDQLKDPAANKADIQNKINEIDAKIKNPYGIVPPTEIVKPVPPKEEPKTIPTKVAAAAMDPYAGLMTKERSLKDLSSDYMGLLGEDEGAKRASVRLAKLDASAAKQEEMAPWLAVIKAGLGMAAGKSPYGITNFAEGAQLGISDYVTAKDNLNKLEEKRFILENELSKQARTEKIAGLKYGQDSIQHTQEMNKTVKLAQIHEQNENARNNLDNAVKMSAAASKGNWDKKDYSKRYDEILDSGLYKQAEKELLDSKGAPAKDSPTFKLWQDQMVKKLISQTESSAGSSMSGWGPVSITSPR